MARKLLLGVFLAVLLCAHAFGSCAAPQNQIEAENCLPGNNPAEWQVSGSGDPTLQGFATDMSVDVGQTINFKISTPASKYTIGIFRLGYYSGLGARKVASIVPSATLPQNQPACLTDSATRLFDCGNWAISASWSVPSTAVSGVYLAVLVRSDTGGASQIVFIVRNDSSNSDMVFQTADESWQAYNPYGGHSLYGPTGFDLTNRAYKVSYNRPFNTLNLENQSWIFYAEYPMIRWLEANGYGVTYISSVDSARTGTLIRNHKVYLSVGHDEYVSGPKRASVEAARDAGVNLAFFSGNEFFWKTRWENSIDGTNTPYRTLVCYKETLGPNSNPAATGVVDPQDPPTWTGTWRDPSKSPQADGGRPENALTGQLFRVNGPGTDNTNLSIKIPASQGKMRFWRNTPNVSQQTSGATWTLPAATLGYEWDTEEDNGFRPAGLFDLSTATYNLTTDYLQDFGGLYGSGTATHHISTYRAPSGALVFGAGTVQWSWGLDSSSGGTVDVNMQQATVNLFADMGVQPATLQGGLITASKSTDAIAPASTISAPGSGSSFQAGSTISITGTAADGGGGLIAAAEVSVDGGSTWHPATGTQSWSYSWISTPGTANILSRAVDDSGNIETPSGGISLSIIGASSLNLNPSTVVGGAGSKGTVTISAPAGTGGVTVTLTNNNSSVVTIPGTVVVPAGSSSATFSISSSPVGVSTPVGITATYASSATATLVVTPSFPPPAGSIAIDAIVSDHQATASSTITSAGFSTVVANELLLALVSSDAIQSNMTVSGVNGGGLAWSLVVRSNAQGGTAEIWRAFAPSVLSNVSATATFSQSSPAAAITIMSFAGVDPSGTNGSAAIGNFISASSAKGAPTASVTTTRNNSWVLGVGTDYANAIARTPGTNQTLVDQYLTPTGDTFWSQRQNAATPSSGTSVIINDTAPTTDQYDLSIVEVRPVVVGPYSISGNLSANGAGAAVTLSGTMAQTVTADPSGNYSFTSLTSGSYTVTPNKNGYAFNPVSQSASITTSSVSGLNFSAIQTFSISGSIIPSASGSGTTVTVSGAGNATTTADSSGNYTLNGVVAGSYTVTPSKLGFGFTPASQPVTVSTGNVTGVNFAAAAQNFSISGNLSANGANASVALSGAATANTTADASGNYSFTGLGNGSYTVTPTKNSFAFSPTSLGATISGGNVTALNFTAQAVATTNLAIDVKVPRDGTTASSSITSATFSTSSGNELLLAFISTDYLTGANTAVTNVAGAGLIWTLVVKANGQSGDSEIWRAFATTSLTNTSVTATLSQSVVSSITIVSYTGVDVTGSNGSGAIGAFINKSAATGAPSASITTTRNNSWVFGVGTDYDNATARSVPTGQSLVHQDLTSAGDTYWVQMQNGTTAVSGTAVSISDTAPTTDRYNLAIVEVLPSLGPYGISGNVSPVQTGTTMSLTGTVTTSTTVDGSGTYAFTGLPNGSYTVTPSRTGTTFTPASQSVTINGNSMPGVNFAIVQPVLALSQNGVLFSGNVNGGNPASASINVTNAGGGILNFTAASDSTWLTVTPTSGTAPQQLQLSASTSGLALGSYIGHVTVTSAGSSGSPGTITVTLKVVMPTDWLMVDHDEARSGNAVDETALTTANVGNLALSWTTLVDGSVTAQPLYVHSISIGGATRDIVVVGTGGNSIYVLDAGTGAQIWKRNFGAPTPNTWGLPDGFGIEGPPVIDRVAGRIYTVSTDGNFHVLSLTDGTDVFTPLTLIANPITNKVWGGLNQAGNSVYVATASNGGDVAPWRGQVYQVDVSSIPKLSGDFVVVPSIPAPNGGGGIWGYGGVSVDLASGNVYAASADDSNVSGNGTEGYTPYSDSVIALNANVGLLGYYQAAQPATYLCSGVPCDLDFASTPVIFQAAGCSKMVAAGNKNGNLYLFKASDLATGGQPLQILTLNVAADSLGSGGVGGVPAYYPATNMLYITDAGPGVTGVAAGVVALQVTNSCTLQVAWSTALGGNDSPNSTPTIANGMLFVGQGNTGVIHAYNASTGAELWHSGANYGAAATFAAPVIAGGKLYTGSWTSFNGGGIVAAFSLPTTSTFSISGSISPPTSGSGTLLTLSGTAAATVTADSSGNYAFAGLANGSYTVTPSKTGFTFNPTSQSITVSGSNIQAVNFTATPQTWSISGNVSANGAGASIALSGAGMASTTADSSGNYTFSGLVNGSYNIVPSKTGFSFSPTSQAVQVNGANLSGINFTVTVPTWSISGNVSTSGAGASVALSGAATASLTADASGNYSFTGLANGAYVVTPTKSGLSFNPTSQNTTVNNGNVSGVNFTAATSGGTGLAIDQKVFTDGASASSSISAPTFSTTTGNELLLAFVATDYISGINTTVSGVTGGGLTWTLVKRTNVQSGGAEIWGAFTSSPLTGVSVKATLSQSVVSSITVISFTGVDTTSGSNGPNAIGATGTGNSRGGAPSASLVTTRNNSWVFGVGNDYDNAIAHTPGAGQSIVHQYLTPTGDTYWVQMQNSTTPSSGTTVPVNDTAPATDRYNLTTVEVRTP
jgi:hypothetical protein